MPTPAFAPPLNPHSGKLYAPRLFASLMNAVTPLRIANVEDDPRFRASLATLLRALPNVQLCGSYDHAAPLLAAVEKTVQRGEPLPFDLVLTDIGLPGMDGIELTRKLKALAPTLRVVVLTVFEEPHTVVSAICAGADGYLLKNVPADEIAHQLGLISGNSAPLSSRIASTLLDLVRVSHAPRHNNKLPQDLGLTPRQLEVLRALVEGLSYKEIAAKLGISLDTVRSYIRQIYSALQVHSVAEAVTYALRHGLA